ncbi:MAG: hypothetical protein NTY19_30215 [Planctomycetota bacterium]|nr:hypothetical protein [Planctomycetota bacterium]
MHPFDLLVYYEQGNPRRFAVPDAFVAKGLAPRIRRVYKTCGLQRAKRLKPNWPACVKNWRGGPLSDHGPGRLGFPARRENR